MAEVTQIGGTTARSGKVVARVETEMVRLKFISLRLFLYFALFALLKKICEFQIFNHNCLFFIYHLSSIEQKNGKTGAYSTGAELNSICCIYMYDLKSHWLCISFA
jgi:hypothetical protein